MNNFINTVEEEEIVNINQKEEGKEGATNIDDGYE